MSPWFQPALPILLSCPARIFGASAMLFVIPLFVLFTGIAIRSLVYSLLQRPYAGDMAFLLYIMNPLILWHGRHPRPEIMASFFLMAGIALLVKAWQSDRHRSWTDLFIGSLCLCLAPFFHVTAWSVLIPVCIIVTLCILSGRTDFLIYPIIQAAALSVFLYQTWYITDTYHIKRLLIPYIHYMPWLAVLFIFGMIILFIVSRNFRDTEFNWISSRLRILQWTCAILILGVCIGCYIIALHTRPLAVNPRVYHYLYRTDLSALANLISMPVSILALTGLLSFVLRRDIHILERLSLAFILVPASLLMGNFHDFFQTRYALVAFLPLMAISVTSLATMFPDYRKIKTSWITTILLICLSFLGRTHLITLREYQNLTKFLQPFAEHIKQQNGIALVEYSRLAAPVDLWFGIPTLGLDNERRTDYAAAESAWADLMELHSDQPAYFLTPFQPPISDQFEFIPVMDNNYEGQQLIQKRWALPDKIGNWKIKLKLYEMKCRKNIAQTNQPYVAKLNSGNMGLRHFAGLSKRERQVDGINISANQPATFPCQLDNDDTLFIPFLYKGATPPEMLLMLENHRQAITSSPLTDNWWIAKTHIDGSVTTSVLTITVDADVFVSDVIQLNKQSSRSLLYSSYDRISSHPITTFNARWARNLSEVCVPVSGDNDYVCLFLSTPEDLGGLVTLKTGVGQSQCITQSTVPAGKWRWCIWPLDLVEKTPSTEWITLYTDRPYDPQRKEYPGDLLALIGYIVVIK